MKKRLFAALLLAALALTLGGCNRVSWRFELETRRDADDCRAQDGTMLAWYSYELPELALVPDRERGGEPPEEPAAVRDAFNAEMERWRAQLLTEYDGMEQLARAAFPERNTYDFSSLGERVALTDSYQTERLLSLRADGLADWGGAHPDPFAVTWSFDLAGGRFVTWQDMTDRPDGLREALSGAVLAQIAASPERYYPDCAAAETLEGAELWFAGDGVCIVFAAGTLAPRGEKLPEFTVSYEDLTPYWNEYGRELLK